MRFILQKTGVSPLSWHTGGIHFAIFSPYKNKIRNSIKERRSANRIPVSVATAASVWLAIGSATHTGTPVIGCRRAEASLPPWQHCFLIARRRWKGGREGRRLSLRRHLCIIHPLSPECPGACVCGCGNWRAFVFQCGRRWLAETWRATRGETGAIIALGGAMQLATPRLNLYIKTRVRRSEGTRCAAHGDARH